MKNFLESKPLYYFILVASPLFIFPIFLFSSNNIQKIIFNTIFLGSFHVLLTPLFIKLLSHDKESRKYCKKINRYSFFVLAIGLIIAVFSSTFWADCGQEKFFFSLIILSASYHSAQQQFGIILSLGQIKKFKVIKKIFNIIPFIITINFIPIRPDINYKIVIFLLLFLLAIYVLLNIRPRENILSFLYSLRLFFWPISIYYENLTPFVFALHGIEYLIYYFYVREKKTNKSCKEESFVFSLDFLVTFVIVVSSYIIGNYLINFSTFLTFGHFLLALHFSIQFRHYWLDRQLFKLSKPLQLKLVPR